MVSTHSRLKAAGIKIFSSASRPKVSTHSRLKAAGPIKNHILTLFIVSTHSRLKAAGRRMTGIGRLLPCFNTQPPEGGWPTSRALDVLDGKFQHTAA